jgi:hypothetical protein
MSSLPDGWMSEESWAKNKEEKGQPAGVGVNRVQI